ncbi:MAG: ParA family protein [Geminicoccaceae bacterium]
MPVVVIASTKGGAGKTTAALVLGCTLARSATTTIIDADPRHPVSQWAKLPGKPDQLTIITNDTEDGIIDEIDEANTKSQFVIVDLEGAGSRRMDFAMNRADMVIIPMKEERQDAMAAIDTIKAVMTAGKANRPARQIPFSILLTQGRAAVKSRTARREGAAMRRHAQIDVFDVELHQRDAYSAMYTTGGSVHELDPTEVNNIPKAIANAEAFAAEVIRKLRELRERQTRDVA